MKLTIYRVSLRFEDIRQMLADEATKGPDVFEAFGMRLPASQITLWGIIVLLCVQLYSVTYLRLLTGKLRTDDAGWEVPPRLCAESRLI